jgi:SAM-dependent methyltransferase
MSKNSTVYSSEDLIKNHRIYSGFMRMGLYDGWSRKDKTENFEILTRIESFSSTPIRGSSMLDVGCGTADLYRYVSDMEIKSYTGIDVFTPAIEKAGETYSGAEFIADDFLSHKFTHTFDFVFCSGAMTTRLITDNYKIMQAWIPKMWKLSEKGTAFNFLLEGTAQCSYLYQYNPDKVLSFCQKLKPQARIHTLITDAGCGDGTEEMHIFLY